MLKSELLAHHIAGQFARAVRAALTADTRLAADIAQILLDAHFPTSIHADIAAAVGLDLEAAGSLTLRRPRSAKFREQVLTAYGYRCAVCGLRLCIGPSPVALDAAHIKWVQAAGPDVVPNGLALCVLHHKLFDLGGFTIADGRFEVVVSELANGEGMDDVLVRHHGRRVAAPTRTEAAPAAEYLGWHRRQVFKERPRS